MFFREDSGKDIDQNTNMRAERMKIAGPEGFVDTLATFPMRGTLFVCIIIIIIMRKTNSQNKSAFFWHSDEWWRLHLDFHVKIKGCCHIFKWIRARFAIKITPNNISCSQYIWINNPKRINRKSANENSKFVCFACLGRRGERITIVWIPPMLADLVFTPKICNFHLSLSLALPYLSLKPPKPPIPPKKNILKGKRKTAVDV